MLYRPLQFVVPNHNITEGGWGCSKKPTDIIHMSKTTVFHKYKWTLREKIILTVPSVLLVGALIYFSVDSGALSTGWTILVVAWAAIFALLMNMGKDKKKKSRLEAIYDPETTEVSVEGNKIYKHGVNKGKLNKMQSAYIKQIGMNPTMILLPVSDDDRKVSIPVRLASKEGFLDFLKTNVLENDAIEKTADIQGYFDEAAIYKR